MAFVKGQPRPANAGRKKGGRNKATQHIKTMAQPYGPLAIKTLVELMMSGEYEPTRVAAAKELLDRGYGKAVQPVEAEVSHNIRYEVRLAFGQAQRLHEADELPAVPNGRDLN